MVNDSSTDLEPELKLSCCSASIGNTVFIFIIKPGSNKIGPKAVASLCAALCGSSITRLAVPSNPIGDAGAPTNVD